MSCGFLIAGGSSNEFGKVMDISFYDIPSDSWTKIGDLPVAINTPVCDLYEEYLYCVTGWDDSRHFAFRRKITAN